VTTHADTAAEREDLLRLREAAVSDREAAVAVRDDMRAANEQLVLATLRADEDPIAEVVAHSASGDKRPDHGSKLESSDGRALLRPHLRDRGQSRHDQSCYHAVHEILLG
jgi:hypothetical protein